MNSHLIRVLVVLGLAIGVAGCNDDQLNPTLPPITGLVGGPTQAGGNGSVAVEVQAGAASAVVGTNIVLRNDSRAVESAVAEVDGGAFKTLIVQGDIGDELVVELTHPTEGLIGRRYRVSKPSIDSIFNPEGGAPVINIGGLAAVSGEGFCHVPESNSIFFRPEGGGLGEELPIDAEARPGLVFFGVPGATAPGTYEVQLQVGGDSGGENDNYITLPFSVEVQIGP